MHWLGHALFITVLATIVGGVLWLAYNDTGPPRCLKAERTDLVTRGEPVYRCYKWSDDAQH